MNLALRPTLFFVAVLSAFFVPSPALLVNCPSVCDCEWKIAKCDRGKVSVDDFTKPEFEEDVERLYVHNAEAGTSLEDKTRLPTLDFNILEKYSKLVNLTLYGVYIKTLKDSPFDNLPALTTLILANNEIEKLTPETFKGLKGVQNLNLNGNKLTAIPSGAFIPLESVVTLDLRDNQLTTIAGGAFLQAPILENLDISGNPGMETFPPELLNLKSLDRLNASGCKFTQLPANFKENIFGIQDLDFTDNAISALTADHFKGLEQLKKLRLGGNKIPELVSGVFAGRKLNTLDLSRNNIFRVDRNAFMNAQVNSLNLSFNPLYERVSASSLPTPSNPAPRFNKFQDIFQHADFSAEIKNLYMAGVNLVSLGPMLKNLASLVILDLSFNNLTVITADEMLFRSPTSDIRSSRLKTLHLHNNMLFNVSYAFDDFKDLEVLTLAHNELRYPAVIDTNSIVELPANERRQVFFPADILDGKKSMKRLDLTYNKFTYFPNALIDELMKRDGVTSKLAGDFLICNWRLARLKVFINSPKEATKRCPSEIRNGIAATSFLTGPKPSCLKCKIATGEMKYLFNLNDTYLVKPKQTESNELGAGGIVGILVAALILLIIIAVVLILLKRRREREQLEAVQEEDPDWDPQHEFYDSFDEKGSYLSASSRPVAHESNI